MRVLVAGDFVPQNRVASMVDRGDYGFFNNVIPITRHSDYSILNFESPIIEGTAKPIVKTGPSLQCHKNAMVAVKYAGFDCVTLANNHFYDFGDKGVSDTLKTCCECGIDSVGGGMNLKEAESVLFKQLKNETLAIINFCENEWSIATNSSGGSAPLNIVHNTRAIQEARKQADYVLVIVHGGTEHYQLPSPRMKETYRFFIEQGADAVVNHHQHCFSGYELYNNKPIFYGLGNFCFDKNDSDNLLWNSGYVAQIEFKKTDVDYELIPYIQCSEKSEIRFLTDKTEFEQKIERLNEIIMNDEALESSFEQMVQSHKSFLSVFEPGKNKYIKYMKSKGLLPRFVSQEKKDIFLELFRCEAHRDVMFELLKRKGFLGK